MVTVEVRFLIETNDPEAMLRWLTETCRQRLTGCTPCFAVTEPYKAPDVVPSEWEEAA